MPLTMTMPDLLMKASHIPFHKRFSNLLVQDFYYNHNDEFSPFGTDDGLETLLALQDWIEKNGQLADAREFLEKHLTENWGVDASHLLESDYNKIINISMHNPVEIPSVDAAVIATTFGQLRLEGKINPELLELGEIALNREQFLVGREDLLPLEEHEAVLYKNRLKAMSSDLKNIMNN